MAMGWTLVWCGAPAKNVDSWTGSIKIGVIAPLAWWAAVYGEDATHAYNYIIDKKNAAWWIDGRQIELIYENWSCAGKDATTAVQKLINVDQVQVILWGVCSAETIPAGKIAQEASVTMVSAVSSSPDISSIWDHIFRYWNDLKAWTFLANTLDTTWVKNIALLVENNDYSINYAKVVREQFNGTIVIDEKINPDEKDLSIVAKNIKESIDSIDKVIFIAVTETLNMGYVQALENEDMLPTYNDKFMWAEAFLVDTILDEFGEKIDGFQTMVLSDELEWAEEITAAVTEGYEVKTNEIFLALMADSADMVLDAIEEGGNDATNIKEYIAAFTAESPRKSLVGDFYFNEDGDGQGIDFVLKTVKWGELIVE